MSIFGLKEKKEALGVTLFENPNFSPELKQQFRNKEDMNFELKYDFSKVNHYYTSVQKGSKICWLEQNLYTMKKEISKIIF